MTMINKGRGSLNLNNVLEPATLFWYEEGDYVRLRQSQLSREVILTKAGRSIWQLVSDGKLTGQEIIENLRHRYTEEVIISGLETMVNMKLIRTKENFLWEEE